MWMLCILDTDSSLEYVLEKGDEETNSDVELCNHISDVIIKRQTLIEKRSNQSENLQIHVFSICHTLITVHSFDVLTCPPYACR